MTMTWLHVCALLCLGLASLAKAGEFDLDPNDKKAVMQEELAEENPRLFEGDIVMSPREVDELLHPKPKGDVAKRESITNKARHWPNGVVPYRISASLTNDARGAVAAAIKHYRAYTCIRLKPWTGERDYVLFVKKTGCFSRIGRVGGAQEISLGDGCQYTGTAIHEIMHALGFYHEQSRRDRDKYIIIYWNNIIKGMSFNFQKYRQGEAETLGETYDTQSIMHYGRTAFGIGGRVTIVARDGSKLGQRNDLSPSDKRHINKMYCGGNPTKSSCVDKKKACAGWARQHCNSEKFKSYMAKNCCKSCRSIASTCKDKYTNCKCMVQGALNLCKNPKFSVWMKSNCCQSCKN